MDVQMENMDPPPCESQSGGKIRKGFKLFGKRKPGNIFSIRSKGDGNNKSPVNRGKTLDGLSETAAPDSEQEPDKEKGQEVSQGEMEQAEEEALGEDGVLAAAHARTSISSASSAKSLSFLSLLRGGRRGTGDRQVHTVSQPVGRQRRGLKGLFGNVKFLSKDKEDKEEAPPSPLLMSSRANSVEIIKEDLTLTPKSKPRSLDSPETESGEPIKSLTTPDRAATTPSETITPQVTADNVSRTNEHVPPLPTSEPPFVPGDNSLSSLLADISSLLTFDSISGGGDIMADVEAEWGKASSAISPAVTESIPSSTSLFSKPSISSPLTSASVSTAAMAKPSPVAIPTAASTKSFTPLAKTSSSSSPIAKPSTIITTLTKTSTLTITTTPVTVTSLSTPITCSPAIPIKSTMSSTSTTTTAPPNTPAIAVKAPSVSPTLTSTVSRLASEIAAAPQMAPTVIKPSPVAAPISAPAKPSKVTHSPPTPVTCTQPPHAKLDSVRNLNLQTSTSHKPSLSSVAGEPKAPVTVPSASTGTTKPSSSSPVFSIKMTTVPTPTTTSGSVSGVLSKPILTSCPVDLKQTPPSPVTAPHLGPTSNLTATTKTQPSPASVPAPFSTPPTTKPAPAPASVDKRPPAPTMTPTPSTHAVVSSATPTPPSLGHIPVSQSKTPPAPAQIPMSASNDLPGPGPVQSPQFKAPPVPTQTLISVSKEAPAPAQLQDSQSKAPSTPAQTPISLSKGQPAPAHIQVSQSVASPAPAQIPISVSKDSPAKIQVPQSKAPPAPIHIPISVSKDPPAKIQVPQSNDPPAPAQIPVSQSKAPFAPTSPPAPCPITSPPSTPEPWPREAPASAKITESGQASVDEQLVSPSSTGAQWAPTVPSKTEELHNESRRRIPQAKTSGLSKIPVVGGGRAGKIPVRENQHADDEASRDPPTPVLEEERPHFNSHDTGSRDKNSLVGAIVTTSKHNQEESQQPPQPKVLTSLPRDSKIPVKHGAQSHTASQIPQAKEPPRTKIPVSKVPVRRVANKPAAVGSSTQIRK